ncbi:hypothetical protein BKA70DRAFT_1451763 [Coprinopsis sp. MPI-PUGE-AT-0042]|nr:hypothetical protein BKA70DRAFT_1451763 [Coprinopsis sp. MPI-PUGE-AT-0042]
MSSIFSQATNAFLQNSRNSDRKGTSQGALTFFLDQALLEIPPVSLLHSEHEPSREEMASTRLGIALRRSALENAQKMFGPLEEYQHQLKIALDLYEGVVSPIRRLPDDLLREVFIHLSIAQGRYIVFKLHKTTLLSGTDPPFSLERVCARWLRLSRSTVELWMNLRYDSLPAEPTNWLRLMTFTDLLLARSKNSLLNITFSPHDLNFFSAAKAAQALHPRLFGQLAWSAERWRELSANPGCIACLQAVGVIPAVLPRLTTIDLQCWWKSGQPIQPLRLPSLRTVFVYNTIEQDAPPSHNYDFLDASGVTHIDVAEFQFSRPWLPKLTAYALHTLTLTLRDQGNSHSTLPPLPTLLMFPKLKALHVQTRHGRREQGIPRILRSLACPNLTSLAIGTSTREEGFNNVHKTLEGFISRSGCQIEELTLSKFQPAKLMRLLEIKGLQSISQLSLRLSEVEVGEVNVLEYNAHVMYIRFHSISLVFSLLLFNEQ